MRVWRYGMMGLLVALLGLKAGCGAKVETSPVSGRITYRGKPVKSGQVLFLSPNGHPGHSELDQDGRYQLSAAVGENMVSIESRGPGTPMAKPTPEGYTKMLPGKLLIPEKYLSGETSGLRVTVQRGENTANFELKD